MFCFFLSWKGFSGCRCTFELLGSHEVLFSAFHGKQVPDHLPGYGERGAVGISFLQFSVVNHRQFMALPGSQFGCFYQHMLDVLVALFGKRHAHHLVGGVPARLRTARSN